MTIKNIEAIRERHSSIQIVPLAPEYYKQALDIARQMHNESIYKDFPLDPKKILKQLSYCGTALATNRYFRLAVRDGEVLGGFFGHVIPMFFCDELVAHDMGWWVPSTRRGSAAAVLLLADFEKWAKEQGAKKVMVGQSTERNIERTTKLYEHCGYRVIGYNTVKEI